MNIVDFHKELLEEVKDEAFVDGEGSTAAFTNRVATYLIDSQVLSGFSPAFYQGKGKKQRNIHVDGYYLDDFDVTLNLIISDYSGNENRETITRTIATTEFDKLKHFIEEVYENNLLEKVEESTTAYDLIDTMQINRDRIRKFRLFLFVDGFMSTRIEKIESQNFNGIPVECQIWDISRLYNVCASDLGRQNIAIDFQEYTGGKGIPCLEASNAINGNYKSYLCVIPGETLAAIYDKYGSLLLEGNVRSFLSTKVAVNKKIRETILKCPQNFFAYNNGIAATAMNLQIQNRESGLYITNAQDFQIINGGQTTASLSNAKFRDHANLDKIYVQMKLTEVEANDDESGELIRNISRSSNNQNKVSDADFFSTHPFHVRVEQLSRRFFAPAVAGNQYETKWFYERARGQYLQAQMKMTKAEQKKFKTQNPKKQVITKTDLAKVRNTWNEIPQIVSKGAQTNFIKFADMIDKEWDKSQLTYNEKYFKDSVALFILFKKTEALVSAQDWFKQGYRANIVTYSLALLHKLIREQFVNSDLDLQRIWLSQDVPNIVINELVKITKYVYDSIICPKTTANVTQWCKRDDCWKEIEKCQLKLSENMADVLLSKGDIANISRVQDDQNIVSEVEAQKLVVNKGPKYWLMVQKFVLAKRCRATELQLKALNYAIKIPLNIPSGLQSQKLLLLEEEVKANGFK